MTQSPWFISERDARARDMMVAEQFVSEVVELADRGYSDDEAFLELLRRGWPVDGDILRSSAVNAAIGRLERRK